MRPVRAALLFGFAGLGALACGSRTPSADSPEAGTSELVWQSLPKEHTHSTGTLPSLKTDDGRPVRLRSITLRATLRPPIAATELELGFDELPAGQSGALLSIALPSDAVLNRFAMNDAGRWHDAERTTDKPPVLGSSKPVFEQPGGVSQTFTARVLGQAGKAPRVLIGFASLLPASDAPYGLRLVGLPELDALDATVRVNERLHSVKRANFVPDRDFVIPSGVIGQARNFEALRAGEYAVARLLPETTESTELTFLVDTSLSQPIPLPKISDSLVKLSERLAAEKSAPLVTVVAFDQEVHPIVVRAKTPVSREQLVPLVALGRMGGTDLSHALESLVAQNLPRRHVVLLSDFKNTLQPVEKPRSVDDFGIARLDSLVADASQERALRKQYDEPLGFKPHVPNIIVRLDDGPERAAKLFLQPTPGKTSVVVKGATWSWPPADEYAGREFTPEIGTAVWVFAEYDAKAPLEVEFNGKPKPAVPPVADAALSGLLKQFVGGAQLRQYLFGFPYAYTDPAQAAHALSEVERLTKAHGLISPLSSFVVRDKSGAQPRILGGRIVDTANTRMIMSTTMVDAPKPKPRPEKCPELVGHRGRSGSDEDCPPLFIDFSEARTRIIADVSFAGGSGTPLVKVSPHLDELADLLTLRPEVTKVSVRVVKKSQAEGVVRYLVERGISADRLLAERLLEGELAPQKPPPKCKTPGQQVLVEVRAMSLEHINQRAVRKPVQPLAKVEPSRLTGLLDSMRASRRSPDPARRRLDDVLASAQAWVSKEPQNPLAYVGLGTVLDARRDEPGAARAYGSLFDIDAPGAGLDLAAAMRFQELENEGRLWNLAMRTYRKKWEDSKSPFEPKHDVEGSRAIAYSTASRKRGHSADETSGGAIHEVVDASGIVEQIEAPVFAHVDLLAHRKAYFAAEMLLSRNCRFPMQGSVLGAVLSFTDAESELEVDVTAIEDGFTYDSVLTDRTPSATLKWLPLPEDDDAYPIRVSVRAERLGKRGYAFGMLRVLNYLGRGRVSIDQKPFVVTRVGERIPLYQPTILQRPQ